MKMCCILIFLVATVLAVSWSRAGQPESHKVAVGTTGIDAAAISDARQIINCQALAFAAQENQAAITHDLRQIKRDLAKLQQRFDEPGLSQIFAGIGYILGLCGAAALVASRKK